MESVFSLVGGIILALLVAIFVVSWFMRIQRKKREAHEKYTVLSIRVSKDNEIGPIVAEQIFSAVHGIFHELSWFDRLSGKVQNRISFEIAHIDRQIRFLVWFPARLRNLIEGQIYAQYPNIEIEEIPDYASIVKPNYHPFAVGAEIGFVSPDIKPIKRYSQFEDKIAKTFVDPIAGVTAALAKLDNGAEQVWIQLVIRPLGDWWRLTAIKCIRIVNRGIFGNIEMLKDAYSRMYTTRKTIYRMIFFPLYFIFWLQGLRSGKKKIVSVVTGESEKQDMLPEEISRAHERESDISAATDKVLKLLFETKLRIVYVPTESKPEVAALKVKEIAAAFKQFNIPHLNGFEIKKFIEGEPIINLYQKRVIGRDSMVMNNEELATIYHLPHMLVATPNIAWVRSKKLEPPVDLPAVDLQGEDGITPLAKTNFRGVAIEFGIKTSDRRRHIYIIGKTGMGKSTLLENMIFHDIQSGKGVAVVDPHGDLADRVIDFIPSHRTNDVILFDPSDRDYPVAFNMLENIDPAYNAIVASGLVGIFKKLYAESWGPRLEHILRNTILALLEYPNTTMLGITRMLQDAHFRHQVMRKITDPIVKAFWISEFEKMDPRLRIEAISPILNKVGQFLSSPIIRNIVGQPKSAVDLRFAMDNKKIVIVNLSKGKIGEDNSSLLGAMMITKFQLDAMSRANVVERERQDFYLYVDEFQNFATESFATILSEARKYKLNLTMANQYIAQMPEEVRDAVFGNVGTLISFQVGFEDGQMIAGQFGGDETMVNDLVGLQIGNTYMRLLIDGMPTKVFSMTTFPPLQLTAEAGRREKIMRFCRERYSTKREIVEDKIRRWSEGAMREAEAASAKMQNSRPAGKKV